MNYTLLVCRIISNTIMTPAAAALAVMCWDVWQGLAMLLIFPAIVPLYRARRRQFQTTLETLAEANATCTGDMLEFARGLPVLRASCSVGTRVGQLRDSTQAFLPAGSVQHCLGQVIFTI